MTLVEVVAGLALLGTLLVSLITTKTTLLRQRRLADERIAAGDALEQLLAARSAAGLKIGAGDSGLLQGGMRWEAGRLRYESLSHVRIEVVRIVVASPHDGRQLIEVDLVQPSPGGPR